MRKEIIAYCQYCKKEFLTRNPNPKFCSLSCSSLEGHKNRRTYEMIEAAKEYWKKNPELKREKEINSQKGKHKKPTSILEVSKRTISKIFRRLNIGCSNCGWNEEVCDLHHIISRKDGGSDDHANLTYLCPNCHRLAGRGQINNFINLHDYIGDRWKEYYYG